MDTRIKKNFVPLLIFLFIFTLFLLVLPGIFSNTDTRKQAAGTIANFQVYPSQQSFQVGETKTFEIKATFSNPSPSESIDSLKMTISFPLDYFRVPDDDYVMVTFSNQRNLEKVFRQDGPVAANQSGKIILELDSATPGSGPLTSSPVTFARFNLRAIKNTSSSLPISLSIESIVNNSGENLPSSTGNSFVQVGTNISPVPTVPLSPLPILSPGNCDQAHGDANCDEIVNAIDFDIWAREYTGEINTNRSDFNQDGKINLVDFEIWRRNAIAY